MPVRAAIVVWLVAAVTAPAAAKPRGFSQPWLGIALSQGRQGVLIKQVVPDTPAEKAGLLEGDEIVAIGDAKTTTAGELVNAVGAYRVGDEIALSVAREGKTLKLSATLARRMRGRELVDKVLMDKAAPAFDLAEVNGSGGGKLSDYRGKVLIVELFSVTCRYCPLTHAALAKARAAHREEGLEVVGISSDPRQTLVDYLDPDYEPKQRVIKVHRRQRTITEPHYGALGFTALHDAAGEVKGLYWVSSFPTVVVIDREGYVRHFEAGAGRATDRAIEAAVALLDEPR